MPSTRRQGTFVDYADILDQRARRRGAFARLRRLCRDAAEGASDRATRWVGVIGAALATSSATSWVDVSPSHSERDSFEFEEEVFSAHAAFDDPGSSESRPFSGMEFDFIDDGRMGTREHELSQINPATGLTMVGGFDIAGNPYGSSSDSTGSGFHFD